MIRTLATAAAVTVALGAGVAIETAPSARAEFQQPSLALVNSSMALRGVAATAVSSSMTTLQAGPAARTASGLAKPVAAALTAKPVVARPAAKRAVAVKTTPAKKSSVVTTAKPQASADQLQDGSEGDAVTALQKKLVAAGYDVPVTGHYGSLTTAAVKQFQADHDLETTGTPGPRTRALLASGASRPADTSSKASQDTASTSGGSQNSSSSSDSSSSSSSSTSSSSSSSGSRSTTSAGAQAVVDFAYAQIGKPYVYGATGPDAYDCSGLTSAAWAAAGVNIPRTSYDQAGLTSVSTSDLQPGDIVVFYGGDHVGIYVGNGYVIHAPRPGKSVEKVPMSTMPVSGAVRPS